MRSNRSRTFLLGAAAQFGVFVALIGTILLGLLPWFDFNLADAASVAIIGGAEGPTTIYVAAKMQVAADPVAHSSTFAAVVVACYSYMALVPIIQPPVIRLLTTKKERTVRMPYAARPVSRRTKIIFPIVSILLCGVFIPKAAPLIGMFMFGNLLRESGVVQRLAGAAQNELMNIVTIMSTIITIIGMTTSIPSTLRRLHLLVRQHLISIMTMTKSCITHTMSTKDIGATSNTLQKQQQEIFSSMHPLHRHKWQQLPSR